MSICKKFLITRKGIENGYHCDSFYRDADEILRHHYNDDFELYVCSYAIGKDGKQWNPLSYDTPRIVGISVSANDEETIDWFVRDWIERGILVDASPCEINGFEF